MARIIETTKTRSYHNVKDIVSEFVVANTIFRSLEEKIKSIFRNEREKSS